MDDVVNRADRVFHRFKTIDESLSAAERVYRAVEAESMLEDVDVCQFIYVKAPPDFTQDLFPSKRTPPPPPPLPRTI